MINFGNLYEYLEIIPTSSSKDILMAYENKITKYNNINRLSEEQIKDIKILKTALYVLMNPRLRKQYDQTLINNNIRKRDNQKRSFSAEPLPENQVTRDSDLDSLFSVDNRWMNNIEKPEDGKLKKSKVETNYIGDRIFSMTQFNHRPSYPSDFETELRKPQQGREDKTSSLVS